MSVQSATLSAARAAVSWQGSARIVPGNDDNLQAPAAGQGTPALTFGDYHSSSGSVVPHIQTASTTMSVTASTRPSRSMGRISEDPTAAGGDQNLARRPYDTWRHQGGAASTLATGPTVTVTPTGTSPVLGLDAVEVVGADVLRSWYDKYREPGPSRVGSEPSPTHDSALGPSQAPSVSPPRQAGVAGAGHYQQLVPSYLSGTRTPWQVESVYGGSEASHDSHGRIVATAGSMPSLLTKAEVLDRKLNADHTNRVKLVARLKKHAGEAQQNQGTATPTTTAVGAASARVTSASSALAAAAAAATHARPRAGASQHSQLALPSLTLTNCGSLGSASALAEISILIESQSTQQHKPSPGAVSEGGSSSRQPTPSSEGHGEETEDQAEEYYGVTPEIYRELRTSCLAVGSAIKGSTRSHSHA
jgi:hypothetical protein